MIKIYCKAHHNINGALCNNCLEINTYSMYRLDKCIYGITKPTCNNCTTHCYKPNMRKKIKKVMRYSGPRMMWHHPILSIMHLIDKLISPKHKEEV